jgi:hypothetical protein
MEDACLRPRGMRRFRRKLDCDSVTCAGALGVVKLPESGGLQT